MCPFRRKVVTPRLNALGFTIQLPKFVKNPAEDLDSGVCAYLTSIMRCTNHCASIIWLGAFLEIAVKPKNAARLTLTCVAVLFVRLGKPSHRGAASNYDRGGVKGGVRALRVGFIKIFRALGAPVVVDAKKQQVVVRHRRRLHAGGWTGRRRRVSAA